jgi:hypothetical protein
VYEGSRATCSRGRPGFETLNALTSLIRNG